MQIKIKYVISHALLRKMYNTYMNQTNSQFTCFTIHTNFRLTLLLMAQLFPCSEMHANKEHRSLHPVKHLQFFTTNELEDKLPAAVSTLGVRG